MEPTENIHPRKTTNWMGWIQTLLLIEWLTYLQFGTSPSLWQRINLKVMIVLLILAALGIIVSFIKMIGKNSGSNKQDTYNLIISIGTIIIVGIVFFGSLLGLISIME
jgi:uncharacterized membrane protein